VQVIVDTPYDMPASASRSIPITLVSTPTEKNR
jgi:hypothetical protein